MEIFGLNIHKDTLWLLINFIIPPLVLVV
jgi:hypothetical protein